MKEDDLSFYTSRLELMNQTANQIIKDFGFYGFDIKFSGNPKCTYEELFQQLSTCISDLLDKENSRLLELLYRIDISETQFYKILDEPSCSFDLAERITELIIRRELQKVVSRKFYK